MFQASPVSINAPNGKDVLFRRTKSVDWPNDFWIEMRNSSLYGHTIGNFSVQIQEYAIMEDLLYVLIVGYQLYM